MAVKPKSQQAPVPTESLWPYGRKNYILFAVAIAVIVVGFVLLGAGDTTWTAFFLVLGFCVIMPWALFARPGDETSSTDPAEPEK